MVGGVSVLALSAGTYAWLKRQGYEIDPPLPMGADPRPKVQGLPGPPYDPRALATLPLLLDVLLPGDPDEGVPSAVEAGVVDYLVAMSRAPGMGAIRAEVLKLCRYLDRKAQSTAGYRFAQLERPEDRAKVVKQASEDGNPRGRFRPAVAMETTLRIALEGYLGHPDHGGNKNAQVWDALNIPMYKVRDSLVGHHHSSPG